MVCDIPSLNRIRRMSSELEAGDDIRSRLDEMRDATTQRIAGLESSFDDIVQAASDVATDDEHDPEGHTIAWERQQIAGMLNEAHVALREIEAAERRLDAGVYGICTKCGSRIARERVRVLPATPTCLSCAR
jgi:DnaK suppressor protein